MSLWERFTDDELRKILVRAGAIRVFRDGDETENYCEILTSVFDCVLGIFFCEVCTFLAPSAPKGEFWSWSQLPAPKIDGVTLPNVKHVK